MIGEGTLIFDYKAFEVTDGTNWFKVLSPNLLYRLKNPKPTRPMISGEWIIIKGCIVWFKKSKYVYHHIPLIQEKNIITRKYIQEGRLVMNEKTYKKENINGCMP